MKKANLFILILITLFGVISCSDSESPKKVAVKFLDSVGRKDYKSAQEYGTEDTRKLLMMYEGFEAMVADTAFVQKKFEVLAEKIEGDKATIMYRRKGTDTDQQLPMLKVNGHWLVQLNKETLNYSEDEVIMDVGATETDSSSEGRKN